MHACTHSFFFANLGQCTPEPENLAGNMQPSCCRVAGVMALVLTSHWWLTGFQKDRRQLSTALQTLSPLCPDYSSKGSGSCSSMGRTLGEECFKDPVFYEPSPPVSFLSSSFLLFNLLWLGSLDAKYILEDIVYSEPQFLEHQKAFRIFHHCLAHFLASLVNRFK